MKAALYLRVSTGDQTIENQRIELERVAAARGWTIADVFQDVGISGSKGRIHRPGFDELYTATTGSKYDVVMAWAVDRISRSLHDLIEFMNHLNACGVHLYLHQQALDTTTPSGKLMFHLTGAFAEYEREIIRERIRVGIARAKAEGVKFGRTPTATTEYNIMRARELYNEDKSAPEIAFLLGISERSVWRLLKLTEEQSEPSYLD